MTRTALRQLLALTIWLTCSGALAQVSGSASVLSDYRWRGLSLSDGKPVPQVALDYDDARGWYAGALASGVTVHGAHDTLQLLGYAGYAARLNASVSWDAGISHVTFQRAALYDYNEVFIGLSAQEVSARLSYAPDYFGKGTRSLYAEINGQRPLAERLNLNWHAGLLHARSAAWEGMASQPLALRADLRLGLAFDVEAWKLELAGLLTQKKHAPYLYDDGGSPRAVTLSATYQF